MTTIPNEVKLKRNTTAPDAASAGVSSGSVTVRSRRHGPAPSVAATSHARSSSSDQNEPTIRTTTAMLKNTWASRIAHTVPSSPVGRTARSAVATTTVGSTNGTSTSASASRLPGNEKRATAHANGRPATRVSAVDTTACQRVNQATSTVDRRVSTSKGRSRRPSTTRLRSRMAASGHAKKIPRNASGTAAAAARPRRLLSGARSASTRRSTGRDRPRSRRARATAAPPAGSRAS